MSDYNTYIESAGISGGAFTRAIHAKYPGFSKIGKSMVCNPERYGVCLIPEAEAQLLAAFGDHPGLSANAKRVSPRPRPARTKPNRLVVYLPDDTNARLRALMQRRGYATVQDFLCSILTHLVNIEERRAQSDAE